jgi:hypothetical protein
MADSEDQGLVQDPEEHWADLMEDDWRLLHRNDDGEGGAGAAAPLSGPNRAAYDTVSYIVSRGVDFDYQDVLELGVDGVLGLYDISADLSGEERHHLRDVLLSLGGRVQTREMARLSLAEDPLLEGLQQRTWPLRTEELHRKFSMQAFRNRQGREPVTPAEFLAGVRSRTTRASELRLGSCHHEVLVEAQAETA